MLSLILAVSCGTWYIYIITQIILEPIFFSEKTPSGPVSPKPLQSHISMIPRLTENDPIGSRNILFSNAVEAGIEPGNA